MPAACKGEFSKVDSFCCMRMQHSSFTDLHELWGPQSPIMTACLS